MPRSTPSSNDREQSIDQARLRANLDLLVPPPAHESFVATGARRTEVHGERVRECYPRAYAVADDPVAHVRFALRHEPVDLTVMVAAMRAMRARDLEAWVLSEPTGAFARRAWFLFETLTDHRLDVPDATRGNDVPALDPRRHVVAARRDSRRHRVADNLFGDARLCPTVRRTQRIDEALGWDLDARARRAVRAVDPGLFARAVRFLCTRETRSSLAIEGEAPSASREERFVQALAGARDADPTTAGSLAALQGQIVDRRFAATGWRTEQDDVGRTAAGYREVVDFVGPRPGDVANLMAGGVAGGRRTRPGPWRSRPIVDVIPAAVDTVKGASIAYA